ncbi:MAG: sensor histidine kinase, partial [Bacillota bacterium]|nr:sensor histidine kinase [Bacillota bacterium]
VMLTIKNISAYELNITSDELMERFKRGDESRSSQGSGLGLSIAKSLIEAQKGNFNIEIDGDLFKAIIQMTK